MTETLYVGGAAGYDQMFARVTQAFIPVLLDAAQIGAGQELVLRSYVVGSGKHQNQRDKQNSVRIWRDSAGACHEQRRQNEDANEASEDVGSTRAKSHVDFAPNGVGLE